MDPEIKIITPGKILPNKPPEGTMWKGTCRRCGCEALFPGRVLVLVACLPGGLTPIGYYVTTCPEEGCGDSVRVEQVHQAAVGCSKPGEML